MRSVVSKLFVIGLFTGFAAFAVFAQDETPTPTAPGRAFGQQQQSQDPQPYEKVITKDAKSKKGIFTVHQVKDKYYF